VTTSELAIFGEIANAHKKYGRRSIRNVIISKTDSVSNILEVAVLLKEVGICNQDGLFVNIVPLFESEST
jgi:phosphoenolpyruvate carboxylase